MIRFVSKNAQGWETTSQVRPFKFPGGEWHLDITKTQGEKPKYAYITFNMARGDMLDDLMQAALWVDWCHSLGEKATILMPYLPAARADRGTPFGAKVYANFINSMGADKVIIFDPHSEIAPNLINNAIIVEATKVVKQIIPLAEGKSKISAIIAPDAGAVDRAGKVAEDMGLPLIKASKKRDFETGRLSHYDIDLKGAPEEGVFLVVDDICDGGGTFRLLAENSGLPKERLALWVSHGIFSGAAPSLLEKYSSVYTSDSLVAYGNIAEVRVPLVNFLLRVAGLS